MIPLPRPGLFAEKTDEICYHRTVLLATEYISEVDDFIFGNFHEGRMRNIDAMGVPGILGNCEVSLPFLDNAFEGYGRFE